MSCSGDCLLPCCLLPQHDVFSPVDFRHVEQMCSCLWTVDATGFQACSWLTLAYHRAAPTSALVGSPVSPGFPTSIPIASRQVPMFLFLLSLLVEHVLPSLVPRLKKGPVLPTHTPPRPLILSQQFAWSVLRIFRNILGLLGLRPLRSCYCFVFFMNSLLSVASSNFPESSSPQMHFHSLLYLPLVCP